MEQRFKGKAVIVTGAASGIGRGVAERFAQEGANVVLADIEEAKLQAVASGMDADRTLVQRCDTGDHTQVQALVRAAVERFGQLDVMVNNAGVASEGKAGDVALDDWDKTIRVDLTGVFYGCRAALPELLKTRGCIVNTASVSGLGADWAMCAYNAAKGGVVNLTRAIALDYGGQGVRCNAVCPSLTRTGMTEDMLADAELVAKFMERLPLGRVAEPADIAAVVAFLASEDARFINGVNLPVDGGVTASNGQPPGG
ncbi:SDR family NAD(P)-dependent oxidoreductase [Pseudorhodoferax sp. Leaf265]|jgi:meso-butanediol dehydrogenase/(S,S)-butanediol dehydrogenase/diacetyl reductase|uniref:SDR family NAD(P)-dependent oxidoreductase n=1 Tax=Pseudorhodoferax sp. Leaf265 TaxID=1736315 RepID=UPI0007011453|nr:SDR family oxidoreductase [Pseudorhodoferax sp. Leaf265]KQP15659.1 3-oxoacyl-ACP reductase [Pseudorhodoferax sp. Leaf265]